MHLNMNLTEAKRKFVAGFASAGIGGRWERHMARGGQGCPRSEDLADWIFRVLVAIKKVVSFRNDVGYGWIFA
jgi:hypothetical protein